MQIQLKTLPVELAAACHVLPSLDEDFILRLIADAKAAHQLHALINNPHTENFLTDVRLEAAHQRDRWGEAHDRGKSAENWFWLVGYLSGKCLRAVITGDKQKAKHHTISSAAALANWFEAIDKDQSGTGLGDDADIRPVEIARFEGSESIETSEREARPAIWNDPTGKCESQIWDEAAGRYRNMTDAEHSVINNGGAGAELRPAPRFDPCSGRN